ncbi:MAG: hypothetical protein ACSHX4_04655 [Opitutaceae bacterium]
MPDDKTFPTFKLSRKPNDRTKTDESAKAESDAEAKKTPLSLLVGKSVEPDKPSNQEVTSVEQILEAAYAPDRERSKWAKRNKRIVTISILLAVMLLSTFLTFGYAHLWQKWPLLQPVSWYIPFILSVVISVYFCIKAYALFSKERSHSLAITGICAALGLAYWNVTVLDYTTHPEARAPTNCFWEPQDMSEMLLAYELNACRGWSTNTATYKDISLEDYRTAFHALPVPEWKSYFKTYLSADELSKVTTININKNMNVVAERMQQRRTEIWTEFDELYKKPPFLLKLKQLALAPYTWVLKLL